MSDIPMLTGPNGGELVFDVASGAVVELLTSGGSFPTHPATDPAPFVLAESRIATLEAAIAAKDDLLRAAQAGQVALQEAFMRDFAASREREAALAVALKNAEETITAAMASASVMNLSAAASRLSAYILCGKDYAVTLARDEAICEAATKGEALKESVAAMKQDDLHEASELAYFHGDEVVEWLSQRIAALKAEGGKG